MLLPHLGPVFLQTTVLNDASAAAAAEFANRSSHRNIAVLSE